MTGITLVPLGLPLDREDSLTAATAALWRRLLETSGWNAHRLAHARGELLRRAEERDAGEPSYAADLRGAVSGA